MHTNNFSRAFKQEAIGKSLIVNADCFDWMRASSEMSVHSIVTDPPYGVKEFDLDQLEKMENGNGGVWRIPPSFDGNQRAPLPRFTALNEAEKKRLKDFFLEWALLAAKILKPGGHIFIATNTFLSPIIFSALTDGGLEYRGMIIRQVRTLRGGDRPKNAEEEFSDVCSMPRGCYEPWGIFRRPLPDGMKVSDCLRKYGTGGLRRLPDGRPFEDLIQSERTPQREREIADHPSLKPQSFLRQLVFASLPLGEGIILDPFMGSGSTIAAAEAMGLQSIGIERLPKYFALAQKAIPKLSNLPIAHSQLTFDYI